MEVLEEIPDFLPHFDVSIDCVKIEEEKITEQVILTPSTNKKKVKTPKKRIRNRKLSQSQRKNFSISEHSKALKVNNKRVNSRTNVICNYCQLEVSYAMFKSHYYTVHLKSKLFSCDECGKTFSSTTRLSIHKASNHTSLKKLGKIQRSFKRHYNAKQMKYEYPCLFCKRSQF